MVELRKNWKTGAWVLAFVIIDWVVLRDIVETVLKMGHN
jgi:hypothetical protein